MLAYLLQLGGLAAICVAIYVLAGLGWCVLAAGLAGLVLGSQLEREGS